MRATQAEVYATLKQFGPLADHVLVPIVQHTGDLHQSSSGIRSRRAELTASRKVVAVDTVTMPSGREAVVWSAK